jgi:nucleotide-binding universal stress UspA family protein
MTRADVLLSLLTYPDPTPDEAVEAAIATAARLGARVTASAYEVEVSPPASPTANMILNFPAMAAEQTRLSRDKASALLSLSEERGRACGVTVECFRTRVLPGCAPEAAAEQARLHGLSLVPVRPQDGSAALAEALIFGSGRPVLVLPSGASGALTSLDRAVVAWDGSRAAARALADALPLLSSCREVTVVTVAGEKALPARADPEAAVAALGRWGVPAEAERSEARGRSAGEALSAFVTNRGADLLVMGGYGHSRLRDFFLGGATRTVLAQPPAPALLSH